MTENNNTKQTRGATLRSPKDVRRVCQRIISQAFLQGEALQYSGRISQLMGCWLKAWEIEEVADLERRLKKLEEKQERE